MSRIFFLVFICFSNFYLYSQNICSNSIYVIYANGMNNDRFDSTQAENNIREVLTNNSFKIKVNYDLAYNYDDLLPLELLEAYQQKQSEDMELFWKWFFDWSSSPDWFKNIIYKYLYLYNKNIIAYSNTKEQIDLYKNILNQKGKILTIAHSQGNLFSNEAFNQLSKYYDLKDKAVLISVATPSSYVYGNGTYVTLSSDGVINAVRIASKIFNFKEPLPANFSNISPKPSVFDHNFIEHYLYSTPTGVSLTNNIVETIKKLESKVDNKKQLEQEFGKTCIDWWNNLKINKKETRNCILKCSSASTNMATFYCVNKCKYFCNCVK